MTTMHTHAGADPVTREERIAAAQALVAVQKRLGKDSEQWVLDLANESPVRSGTPTR